MSQGRFSGGVTGLLVGPDRALLDQFLTTLAEARTFEILAEVRSYPTSQALEMRLRQLQPAVVLLDTASDLNRALELIEFIVASRSGVQVVALHRHNESAAILKVLRAGASEFLHAPFEVSTQREAAIRLDRLRQPAPAEQAPAENGTVIAFTSAKPGSGASTLAAQTAFALKRLSGKRVLLADLDLMGGTIAFYLKVSHAYSLVEALQHAEHLDAALWNSLTVSASGIDILPAPPVPYTGPIESSRLHVVLSYARMAYDWVVVDLPLAYQRTSLMALAEADHAYLVTTSELPSLHLARKAVSLLEQLGMPKERYQMIINRMARRDGLGTADMEKLFNCPVHAVIPNDYFSLHRVITLGQPLSGEGDIGKAVDGLAGKMAGAQGAAKRSLGGVAAARPALSAL